MKIADAPPTGASVLFAEVFKKTEGGKRMLNEALTVDNISVSSLPREWVEKA